MSRLKKGSHTKRNCFAMYLAIKCGLSAKKALKKMGISSDRRRMDFAIQKNIRSEKKKLQRARALADYIIEKKVSNEKVAKVHNLSRRTICNAMKLLKEKDIEKWKKMREAKKKGGII